MGQTKGRQQASQVCRHSRLPLATCSQRCRPLSCAQTCVQIQPLTDVLGTPRAGAR